MIKFIFPYSLFGLLGIVFLLINRKNFKKKNKIVSSLELWRNLSTFSQKHSKRVSYRILILQILIYIFLNLALANPVWIPQKYNQREIHILLDTSASMNTVYNNISVFKSTISCLRKLLAKLDTNDRVYLTTYPPQKI